MNKASFTNKYGERVRRVNKREARNLAARGVKIGVCPCNMHPFNMWAPAVWFDTAGEAEAFDGIADFDKFVNAFEYYNCDRERGYYAAYYVREA